MGFQAESEVGAKRRQLHEKEQVRFSWWFCWRFRTGFLEHLFVDLKGEIVLKLVP